MTTNNTTPEEEVYLYWFSCRVMSLAIRNGKQNWMMTGLRNVYRIIGRKYVYRSPEAMAEDIEFLGQRLSKRLRENKKEGDFKL